MTDKNLHRIYEKFDNDVLLMIVHAKAANITANIDCLYPESFIIGILTTGANSVNSLLIKQDINLESCLKKFKLKLLEKAGKKNEEIISYENMKKSKLLVEVCYGSEKILNDLKNSENINIQHVFLAILAICSEIREIFEKENLNINKFVEEVKKYKNNKTNKKKQEQEKLAQPIESFCTNMTEMAANNKYDPIISRDEEIEEAITILCRRNKSNPILVGPAGTGKTAIVAGICQRIVSNTVPNKLKGYKILGLNMGALVAGTKYRGEFESRIQALLKVISEDPTYILFIDEIHTIVGAGSASGSTDAANMLKPALARDLKCIGATTNIEYKKYFSGDSALDRRFEKIDIDEPNKEQTKKILIGIKSRFEDFHNCIISEDAIDTAISLTGRYITDKFFPDKAISCIDTACAKYAWKNNNETKSAITSSDVAVVVSKQCQVPLEVIMWDNSERIKNVEAILASRVMGEDHAIKSICRALKNSYSGVRNPSKPIGIFVFGGQSGTGKTYVAKELAKALFNKDSSFIRLDMSEFSEPHSVSKIIGSPPGYVGFNQIDVISDKIRRKPYCVLLLDELEKAHTDVIRLFLQVMSDGCFTDSIGNKVDCKNIILIMTGNFGMNEKGKSELGFSTDKEITDIEKEQNRLIDYCKTNYGVEFINRVDEFIPFMKLNDLDLLKIIKIRLNEFLERIISKNLDIKISNKVPEVLLSLSKEEHGINATVIDRIVSKYIEPCIADKILDIKDSKKHIITIDTNDNKFTSEIKSFDIDTIPSNPPDANDINKIEKRKKRKNSEKEKDLEKI